MTDRAGLFRVQLWHERDGFHRETMEEAATADEARAKTTPAEGEVITLIEEATPRTRAWYHSDMEAIERERRAA